MGGSRGQKRHINIWHINFLCRHSPPVCPRDKPGLSQGQTGLPLCKIRRKPRFVPGTNPLCPGDKPGLSRGHSRGVPRATGPKSLCLCAFFLPEARLKNPIPEGDLELFQSLGPQGSSQRKKTRNSKKKQGKEGQGLGKFCLRAEKPKTTVYTQNTKFGTRCWDPNLSGGYRNCGLGVHSWEDRSERNLEIFSQKSRRGKIDSAKTWCIAKKGLFINCTQGGL